MNMRDVLASQYESLLFLTEPEYDAAILGVAEGWCETGRIERVIYDRDALIDVITQQMEGSDEERYESAVEYFEFNIAGAYFGPGTPMFLKKTEEDA